MDSRLSNVVRPVQVHSGPQPLADKHRPQQGNHRGRKCFQKRLGCHNPASHFRWLCQRYRSRIEVTPEEELYGQIEGEVHALVFAVTHFRKMAFDRRFVLQVVHQPLLKIFDNNRLYTANRLQRWALTMLL